MLQRLMPDTPLRNAVAAGGVLAAGMLNADPGVWDTVDLSDDGRCTRGAV